MSAWHLLFSAQLMVLWLAFSPALADVRFEDGKLVYQTDERDNRVPDFSYAGYRASEVDLPLVPVKVRLEMSHGDDTAAIQAALDQVALLPPDTAGFRGAVLLAPGEFVVRGTLQLKVSGVVLRGSGSGPTGTTLRSAGSRDPVIQIAGETIKELGSSQKITDSYVPVGAQQIKVEDSSSFRVGDSVAIIHPSTKEWIEALGMEDFGGDRHGPQWRSGSRDLRFLRTIEKIDHQTLYLDCPLTLGLDQHLSQSHVVKFDTRDMIQQVGVENLRIVAQDAQRMADEDHAWMGICIEHARDCWVRHVSCERLVCSAVAVWHTASRITVEDCKNLQPRGELGGWRRLSFLNCGSQVLMQRLFSENALHDFAIGDTATGPNVFLQCESSGSLGESGTLGSAACGGLFDNVRIDGHKLTLRNRTSEGQGVGWTSFNSVLWNSSAAIVVNEKPALGQNWSFGSHGQFSGNGRWIGSDDDVAPDSLFYAQLKQRGVTRAHHSHMLRPSIESSRAPTLDQADQATTAAKQPRMSMSSWIDQLATAYPIEPAWTVERLSHVPLANKPAHSVNHQSGSTGQLPVKIINGWITIDGRVACGDLQSVPWWGGGLQNDQIAKAKPALTRFVPGRAGNGLTDRIDDLARDMQQRGQIGLWQHPPLWYERRRDDHTRVRQLDGDVVAPFYEVPWQRSGSGTAYDGLSRWDLTQVNPWYFARLRSFSQVAAERGLILFNGLYMQHSLLEAGAHYVDSPWRRANNVNQVGLPEPVAFAGDKLIFAAEQFYDVDNQAQVNVHQQYMRGVLEKLGDQPNTVLFLSEEYTGPLAFMQLWLDTVEKWSVETGQRPLIALVATKDVTDAILTDEQRRPLVSMVVNAHAWWYQPSGALYAPHGGKHLAPRQWMRLLKPKNPEFTQVHQTVREYRVAQPDKPFVYVGTQPQTAWAVLLAGGSLPNLPVTTDRRLLAQAVNMKPLDSGIGLADTQGNRLVYFDQPTTTPGGRAVDMSTGQMTDSPSSLVWISSD